MIYYINSMYFQIHVNHMEYFHFNAIVGVPTPGPYYIYNYFSDADPLNYLNNQLSF